MEKTNRRDFLRTGLTALLGAIALAGTGCEKSSKNANLPSIKKYRINGYSLEDINSGIDKNDKFNEEQKKIIKRLYANPQEYDKVDEVEKYRSELAGNRVRTEEYKTELKTRYPWLNFDNLSNPDKVLLYADDFSQPWRPVK